MEPKYRIGQKVLVKQVEAKLSSARDSNIGQYAGQSGTVTNYYWLSPQAGEVFYIYTVKIGAGGKELILHEDEIIRA